MLVSCVLVPSGPHWLCLEAMAHALHLQMKRIPAITQAIVDPFVAGFRRPARTCRKVQFLQRQLPPVESVEYLFYFSLFEGILE